jgi:hypothetical protein
VDREHPGRLDFDDLAGRGVAADLDRLGELEGRLGVPTALQQADLVDALVAPARRLQRRVAESRRLGRVRRGCRRRLRRRDRVIASGSKAGYRVTAPSVADVTDTATMEFDLRLKSS